MSAESTTDKQWFGHPRGLATLFFTEMWERFSYYGMRALLQLFMTAAAATGGLGFTQAKAGAIVGLFGASAYGLNLAGGWVADRLIGQRRAVFWGGVLIAIGNLVLVVPSTAAFYFGLVIVALGTGLLKPNVSTIVGDLYPDGGARRDAGFSIFYMGINVGAMLGPIACGWLGENINWRYGFLASAVGMVVGLIQYKVTGRYLGDKGLVRASQSDEGSYRSDLKKFLVALGVGVIAMGAVAWGVSTGRFTISEERISDWTGIVALVVVALYFFYLQAFAGLAPEEKKGVGVIFLLFFAAMIFWAGFEQAATSFNIFARDLTDRQILTWTIPTGWFQSINSVFIILLAPLFATFWQSLAARQKRMSMGTKFSYGLLFLSVGFLVMVWASARTQGGADMVLPSWLVATYFFHTVGELCISPVGLSSVTKLAPRRLGGQMMGIWFMAAALGNLFAGRVGGKIAENPEPRSFLFFAAIPAAVALILPLFFARRWAKDAMAKAEGKLG